MGLVPFFAHIWGLPFVHPICFDKVVESTSIKKILDQHDALPYLE